MKTKFVKHGWYPVARGCVAGLVLLIGTFALAAPLQLPHNPRDLIRRVAANELAADSGVHFMYRDTKQKDNGDSVTKEMIDTPDGVLGRVIAINGKPLTPAQRAKEDKRLNHLLNDPTALAQKRKEQQEDEKRIRTMVGALPDAFDYQYAGTQPGPHGEWVLLKFTPNPHYDPPTREQQVYTGMNGDMVVDPVAERLVKIDGTLFREVSFGWGILGRLDKGGRFVVEQSDVGNGHWEPTRMVLHFTGKMLLFKSLKIQSIETTSDYRRVPNTLTVAQAMDMLRKADGLAENSNGGGK